MEKNPHAVYQNEIDKLKKKSHELQETFVTQMQRLTADGNQVLKAGALALAIGAAGFLAYRLVTNRKGADAISEGKNQLSRISSASSNVVEMIRNAMVSFLLSVLRERLISFIERVNQKSDDAIEGIDHAAAAAKN
jgi:hypothetical protein